MEAHVLRRGSRPRRLVGRHLRPPQERWPADRRRAPPGGWHPGSDAIRHRRRPADAGRQDLCPVRPAAGLRVGAQGRPRRWRRPRSPRRRRASPSTTPANWSSRSSPSIPSGSSASIDLPPNNNQVAPVIVTLTPEDLPERVEAWASIDRLVWQDVGGRPPHAAQLAALRGWLAGGGRLVIAGGTIGPAALAAFPDATAPVPAGRHDRRPRGRPDRSARRAPDRRDDAAGAVAASSSTAARSRRSAIGSSRPSGRTAPAR